MVMNRMQAWSGMFAVSSYDGVISPDYSIFQPITNVDIYYFERLFKTPSLVDEFAKLSRGIGSGFNRLYTPDFGSVSIGVPPLPEQHAIVHFLDWAERRIRKAIRLRQKRIKLLEEYKQALIHQAVTGQIDVRTGKPYPEYKDSGVEWLGKVPKHWEVVPLKWLARCYRNGTTPPTTKDLYYEGGTIPWYGPSSFDSSEIVSNPVRLISNTAIEDGVARLIHGPALLVVVIGATAGRMTLMEQDGTTNQQITAFELPYDWKTCLFLLRQLRFSESWLRETASTATIPILNTNIVTHLPCLMPPHKERIAIVEYLDVQTAKIDATISKDRRAIELLKELRTTLIAEVVTGKVDVREIAARLPEEPEGERQELKEEVTELEKQEPDETFEDEEMLEVQRDENELD